MIARLWWKEARQVWPVWGLLAAGGLTLQAFVWLYWGDEVRAGGYAHVGLVVTMMYLFLIAAAVFAGERENRTLGLLDAIPVERWRVWTAKATFAVATTAALGGLLWLGALGFGGASPEWRTAGFAAIGLCLTAMGWGLLCSSLLSNALFAAVLGMTGLSVSLLALVDLNDDPPTLKEAAPLLIVALATTAASALAFHLGGPPRWEYLRRVRPGRRLYAPMPPDLIEIEFAPRRPSRIWQYSVPRIVWETLREVRPALWVLIPVGVVAPLALAMNSLPSEVSFWVYFSMGITAIVTGASAFNGENRGRTHRFLLQHGARPGVVWTIKVLIWWLVAAVVWWVASVPLGRPPGNPPPNMPWVGYASVIFWAASALTIGFAAAVLCGMAFRRGITAGLIAFIVCVLIYLPLGALFAAGAFYPWHVVHVAIALLAVSWAWSGDWLLDRPGVAKWARLGLYSTLALAGLSSAYIVDRAWGVPTLSPFEANRIFQFDRIAGPIAEQDNAAPLYREAARLLARSPLPALRIESRPWWNVQSLVAGEWDNKNPVLTDWLNRIEPALVTLREAARKPACRYDDLRKTTEFATISEPPLSTLAHPPAVSARARCARGDLEGAWTEIETLLRMARQYSHEFRPWSYRQIESFALGLAMNWAADARQTAATLEAARSAWKDLPSLASPADQARSAALVFQNTLAMPRDDLADNLFFKEADGAKKKVDPLTKLQFDLQTTPWEIVRVRKVSELLAAATIQNLERNPIPTPPADRPSPPYRWPGLDVEEGGRTRTILPEELQLLSDTTRLTQHAPWGWVVNAGSRDLDNEVARRALDLIFGLRLWQVQHDGALPRSLADLPPVENETEGWPLDVYSSKPFGYIPSNGQRLLPLGVFDTLVHMNPSEEGKELKPTDGCMLLYSVGPNGVDDRALRNVNWNNQGDVVFPLKDGVKPPGEDR